MRAHYAEAIGFTVQNIGASPIKLLRFVVLDPLEKWTTEGVWAPAIMPGEFWGECVGILGAKDRTADPSREDAVKFYLRGMAFIFCTDARGREYMATPLKVKRIWRLPWKPSPLEEFQDVSLPTRGGQVPVVGVGRPPAAYLDQLRPEKDAGGSSPSP